MKDERRNGRREEGIERRKRKERWRIVEENWSIYDHEEEEEEKEEEEEEEKEEGNGEGERYISL